MRSAEGEKENIPMLVSLGYIMKAVYSQSHYIDKNPIHSKGFGETEF